MIRYKPFELHYLDQVLVLLEPLWGHLSLEERKAYFEWKYLQNPNTNQPTAYIAIDSDFETVIGFRGYFVLNYLKQNDNFIIATFSDAVVSEKYRGKGVFKELTAYSFSHLNEYSKISCINSISSNKNSNYSYYKLKSQKLFERKKLYRITNLFKIHKKHLYTVASSKKVLLEEIQTLSKTYLSKNKFSISYDNHQLYWRYSNPTTDYHFIYIKDKHNKLVAYISYYKIDSKRVHIIDYMYKTIDQFKIGLSELENKEKTLLTLIEVFSTDEEQLFLHELNFKELTFVKKIFKKPLYNDIVVRPLPLNFEPKNWLIDGTDIREITNWQLSLICSDGI